MGFQLIATSAYIVVETLRCCRPICFVKQHQGHVDDSKSWSWLQLLMLTLMP